MLSLIWYTRSTQVHWCRVICNYDFVCQITMWLWSSCWLCESKPLVPVFPGDICPPGYYCVEGSHTPVPCTNGTYMNHTGGSQCYVCPEGYYCVNRDRADPCLKGYYCPEGTGADLQPCPTGTFGNTTGLGNEGECTNCTGKYSLPLALIRKTKNDKFMLGFRSCLWVLIPYNNTCACIMYIKVTCIRDKMTCLDLIPTADLDLNYK